MGWLLFLLVLCLVPLVLMALLLAAVAWLALVSLCFLVRLFGAILLALARPRPPVAR